MQALVQFLISSLASFFPERWRRQVAVSVSAAAVSGAAEFIFCLGVIIYRYFTFMHMRMLASMDVMLKSAERAGETAIMGSGFVLLLEYVIQPLTIVLCYFTFEGVVRLVAAVVTDEMYPSLPFYLALLLQQKIEGVRRERALGERVVDEVRAVDSDAFTLQIASCRPKEGWNKLTTIAYQDQLYELAAVKEGLPPRPFVYLLRPKPDHKVIRGIHHYDPEEILAERQSQSKC